MLKRKAPSQVNKVPFKKTIFPVFDHLKDEPVVSKPKRVQKVVKVEKKEESISFFSDRKLIKHQISVTSVEDLVVKKDRIAELRTWLTADLPDPKSYPLRILLVTGPTGCGKSTTIRVLCEDLGYDLIEYEQNQALQTFTDANGELQMHEQNQMEAFSSFIRTSSKKTLGQSAKSRKIVLVREIPNVFVKTPLKLFQCLERLKHSCRCNLIFCLTQIDAFWDLNPIRFFPSNFIMALKIKQVKFNPIVKNEIAKTVKKWAKDFKIQVDHAFINAVKEKADGDLTCVISMLEIARIRKSSDLIDLLHGSDIKSELVHYIAQVVYAKRLSPKDGLPSPHRLAIEERVPLSSRRNVPPKYEMNKFLNECPCSSKTLIDYVSEHKLKLFNKTKPMARIFRDLCLADMMTKVTNDRCDASVDMLAKELVVFSGFYHSNGVFNSRGMYTIDKPRTAAVKTRQMSLREEINRLYPSESYTDRITTYLPIACKINGHYSLDEINLLESFRFS